MHRQHMRVVQLTATVTACLMLLACTAAPAQPTQVPASSLQVLQVGMLPATDFLGFYVAVENGYFQEQGLKPEVRIMSGGAEIIPALLGGSLDIGITNTFSHALAA